MPVDVWPAGCEKDESSNSLRKTREAAKQQVQALRAEHSSWQLGEFLARVGCGQEFAAPTSAAEFETLKEQGMAALKHKAAEGELPACPAPLLLTLGRRPPSQYHLHIACCREMEASKLPAL